MSERQYVIRLIKDRIIKYLGFTILSMLFIILAWILSTLVWKGVGSITIRILTTYGNTSTGGLLNAIIGTWLLIGVALLVSMPVGVFGAVFISEYGNNNVSNLFRLFTDLLTGIPSIVLGLFGFLVLVIYMHMGYSLLAGGIILGIMMIPYILRVSELALSMISREIKEAAFALGANKMQVILRFSIPQAKAGIMTGTMLAISIAIGETAQLLYTAGWNNGLPTGLIHSQVAYLTYVVWNGINQPTVYAHGLAYAAALVLVITVISLLFISKYISRRR